MRTCIASRKTIMRRIISGENAANVYMAMLKASRIMKVVMMLGKFLCAPAASKRRNADYHQMSTAAPRTYESKNVNEDICDEEQILVCWIATVFSTVTPTMAVDRRRD